MEFQNEPERVFRVILSIFQDPCEGRMAIGIVYASRDLLNTATLSYGTSVFDITRTALIDPSNRECLLVANTGLGQQRCGDSTKGEAAN